MTTPTNSNNYPIQGGPALPVTVMNPDNIGGGGGGGGGDASAANQLLQLTQETNTATGVAALVPTTDFDSKVGSLTEAAPATDTASSGLNGRLQRIAQRLTTILASTLGFSVGSGTTDATTLRVVTASDGPTVSVLGATNGAAVITDANGSIQQYLRGIVAKLVAAFLAANTARTTATLVLPVQNVDAFGKVAPAGGEYETVAASQTAQALGATGAAGDYLSHVILQPTATNAGTTTILDNATVIYTFTTGTLSDLRPIIVPINAISVSGAWKITTGASITATAFGDFT